MQALAKAGLDEYKKRKEAEQNFADHTGRIKELLELGNPDRENDALLVLTPLISIAWTDGKVGRSEQDAILRAADIYGIFKSEGSYVSLMESLITRPDRTTIARRWDELATRCRDLNSAEATALASHLYQQTKYVGELSEKYTFGLWRAYRIGREEQEHLANTERRISNLILDPPYAGVTGELTGIVPLVKVAWADGHITRRERQMILDSLAEMDIPGSEENLRTLADWLNLKPDDEFFARALQSLRNEIANGDRDAAAERKYDILSRCTLVAEVSGGSAVFTGGGVRICDEEIQTVKQIARILNGAMSGRSK